MRKKWTVFVVTCCAIASVIGCARVMPCRSSLSPSFFSDMIYLQNSRSARVSSFDRTGRNADMRTIRPGGTLELATIEGAGCIRHIYFTIGGPPHYLRDLVLRMYWDGSETPCVETPFGDFFGLGHERVRFFRSLLVTVNTGANGVAGTYGLNSYFPMPFAKGARLTLTNEGSQTVGAVWYHIDYEKLDRLDPNVGRFHAVWHRENPTMAVGDTPNQTLHNGANLDGKENYVILEATGHGNFAGYFLNVDNIVGGWYGEGDDMIFIDGEKWPPSFHGTGSEEIFGGGACPNVEYAGPYTGFYLIGNRDFAGKVSMYRFYVTDPIRFQKSIRATIEHGHANNMANDYSSTAFWYQTEPHAPFPKLLPASERHPRLGTDPHDMAFQKYAEFQQKFGQATAVVMQKKAQIPPEDLKKVMSAVTGITQLFERGDYEAIVRECESAITILDNFIAANK